MPSQVPAPKDKSWSNVQAFQTRGVHPRILVQELDKLMEGKIGEKYKIEVSRASAPAARKENNLNFSARMRQHGFYDPTKSYNP